MRLPQTVNVQYLPRSKKSEMIESDQEWSTETRVDIEVKTVVHCKGLFAL
jgi:hypothetical protein